MLFFLLCGILLPYTLGYHYPQTFSTYYSSLSLHSFHTVQPYLNNHGTHTLENSQPETNYGVNTYENGQPHGTSHVTLDSWPWQTQWKEYGWIANNDRSETSGQNTYRESHGTNGKGQDDKSGSVKKEMVFPVTLTSKVEQERNSSFQALQINEDEDSEPLPFSGNISDDNSEPLPFSGNISDDNSEPPPYSGNISDDDSEPSPYPGNISDDDSEPPPYPGNISDDNSEPPPYPGNISDDNSEPSPYPGNISDDDSEPPPYPGNISDDNSEPPPYPGNISDDNSEPPPYPGNISDDDSEPLPFSGNISDEDSEPPPYPGNISDDNSEPPPYPGNISDDDSEPPPYPGNISDDKNLEPYPISGNINNDNDSEPPSFPGNISDVKNLDPPPFPGNLSEDDDSEFPPFMGNISVDIDSKPPPFTSNMNDNKNTEPPGNIRDKDDLEPPKFPGNISDIENLEHLSFPGNKSDDKNLEPLDDKTHSKESIWSSESPNDGTKNSDIISADINPDKIKRNSSKDIESKSPDQSKGTDSGLPETTPFSPIIFRDSDAETTTKIVPKKTLHFGSASGWHVGIYSKRFTPYMQICGGSLVKADIVLSAAHCFWSDAEGALKPGLFAVAAGKVFRAYEVSFGPSKVNSENSDVKDIKIPPRFLGAKTSFQDDIAILFLARALEYGIGVRPVCVSFDLDLDQKHLTNGNLGRISGWGLTTIHGQPAMLQGVVKLPYLAIEECLRTVDDSFLKFITSDKICAGDKNSGKALCRGDSGGGLIYYSGNVPYIHGVASTAQRDANECNPRAVATFTHVLAHQRFLRQHVPGIDNRECAEVHYKLYPDVTMPTNTTTKN